MNRTASIASGVNVNLSASSNEASRLDRFAPSSVPSPATRFDITRTLALKQGGWNDQLDATSFAKLSPPALVNRLIKNGLVEIDPGGDPAIKKKLVRDLIDIAATPIGRQTLLGAVKTTASGVGFTPFSINVEVGYAGEAYATAITLGNKLFAEDCHLVGDTVSSGRSIFVLFHELVHVNQHKARSKLTMDQREDDAVRRTDVFTTQFNRANGTNYPPRITYGKVTAVVCPVSSSKEVLTPDQLNNEIQKFKKQSMSGTATQRDVATWVLDPVIEKMEALVRVEFGSDTLREPGGIGRRKQVLDSLITLRSAAAKMRNDRPVTPTQVGTLVQTYKSAYKSFFDGLSIDNIPSLPRRRDGGLVRQ